MENNTTDLAKRHTLYLERAEEAERMAKSARGKLAQDTFRSIADSWRQLAQHVGRSIERGT